MLKKTKYLQIRKKLSCLITNDYPFFSDRMYFASNNGPHNTFVYQPTLDTLELKKHNSIDYVFSWKSNGVYNCKLKP